MIFQGILEQQQIERKTLQDYGSGIGIEISKSDSNQKKEFNTKSNFNERLSPQTCKAYDFILITKVLIVTFL